MEDSWQASADIEALGLSQSSRTKYDKSGGRPTIDEEDSGDDSDLCDVDLGVMLG